MGSHCKPTEVCESAQISHVKRGEDGYKKSLVLAGLANAGKSVIFNHLTKAYSFVANYSQTTTYSIRGDATLCGEKFEVVDTPGISSLWANTADEKETRDLLTSSKPDVVMVCGDATQLRRSLMLLLQIQELGLPTIFCINKVDLALQRGNLIDAGKVAATLLLPVVEASAIHGVEQKQLEFEIKRAASGNSCVTYPAEVEAAIAGLLPLFPKDNQPSKGALLLMITSEDDIDYLLEKYSDEVRAEVAATTKIIHRKTSITMLRNAIFNAREGKVDQIADSATHSSSVSAFGGIAKKLAWVTRHPLFGWPVLFGILGLTFYGVGNIANSIAGFLDNNIFIPLVEWLSSMITIPILHEFLLGDFGLITMGMINAVVTVVPILLVFFLIINFLEDVGYLPNLSVLAHRTFSYFGLTGKAILPITLGFGCNTMATITSRMLETKKERVIVSSLIALGVPCSVQLGVMLAILSTAPYSALLIVIGTVVGTQVVSGLLLNKFYSSSKQSNFIIELPEFSMPNMRNIVLKTYYRIKMFLIEVMPMFIFAALLMFGLEKTGLLSIIKKIASPVITGLLSMPDKVTEVFILVISRREVGAVYFKDMVDAAEVDYIQTVVGLIVMTLFIPCMSNTMVMFKELGLKLTAAINISIIIIAIAVGAGVNMVLRIFI